ncbi:hypothetical protein HDU77_009775 [Chytriomyces hyalinus]|nr:hypothetical protein HDU77_009775 [Chytriomyces hyalinus]
MRNILWSPIRPIHAVQRARILQTQTPNALRLISVLSKSTPSSPQSQDRLHAHHILPLNINATDAHNAPVNVLVYNGPVSNFVSSARYVSWINLAAHAVGVPLAWSSFIMPPKVLALMFSTTAFLPVIAVGFFSVSYVTRMWIASSFDPSQATKINPKRPLANQQPDLVTFETSSFLVGTPKKRTVPSADLRISSKWIFGTWKVLGDPWYKPAITIDPMTLTTDPSIKRIHDLVQKQSSK